jgi:hypothetical protein
VAVAFDVGSESDAGTTGSVSVASFSWTHTPVGTPRGVLIFVYTNTGTDYATSVTYGGVSVPRVANAIASDVAGESGTTSTFFLGHDIPTGAQTVVVNRPNDVVAVYATAVTVTALCDTEVGPNITLLQSDQAMSEQSVNDGSPGTNSLRFAGVNWGGNPIPTVGANSTAIANASINYGARTARTVQETTAGQGARLVGFTTASDDVAAVHLAVIESPRTRKVHHYARARG